LVVVLLKKSLVIGVGNLTAPVRDKQKKIAYIIRPLERS
jgi:hypothetical protein